MRTQTVRINKAAGDNRITEEKGQNSKFESYTKRVKITAIKLTRKMEFRIWLESFQIYVQQFKFYKAFNLRNYERISEKAEFERNEARGALMEWLDGEHRTLIFGVEDPTDCLL